MSSGRGKVINPNRDFKRKRKVFTPQIVELDPDTRESIVKKMAEKMFATGTVHKGRRIEDGYLYSKRLLERICRAERDDGRAWRRAPGAEQDDSWTILRKRLAVFGYDLDMGDSLAKTKEMADALITSKLLPSDLPKMDGRIKYGANVTAILNEEELKTYKKFIKQMQLEFPQLTSPADMLGLEILAMIKVRLDRVKLEVGGDSSRPLGKDVADLTELYTRTTDNLGISGKQRRDKLDGEGVGGISSLVSRYKKRLDSFPEDEKRRFVQEAQLCLQAWARGDMTENDVVRMVNLDVAEVRKLLQANGIDTSVVEEASRAFLGRIGDRAESEESSSPEKSDETGEVDDGE